jgi:hypothetical protein
MAASHTAIMRMDSSYSGAAAALKVQNNESVMTAKTTINASELRKKIDKGMPRDFIDRNVKIVARLSAENEVIPHEGEDEMPGCRIIRDPKHPKRGHTHQYMNTTFQRPF